MSQKQENQDDRDDLALEPELLPDDKDSMELEPESLTDGMPDEMSNEIEEAQESGGIPDSQLESQSENTAESEVTAELGKAAEEQRQVFKIAAWQESHQKRYGTDGWYDYAKHGQRAGNRP